MKFKPTITKVIFSILIGVTIVSIQLNFILSQNKQKLINYLLEENPTILVDMVLNKLTFLIEGVILALAIYIVWSLVEKKK